MLVPQMDTHSPISCDLSSSRRPLFVALVCVLLAPLALAIDLPVARHCLTHGAPGDLRRILGWSEVVAQGLGVAILAVVIFVLDPVNRRRLPRLLAATYSAGLVTDTLKLLVARIRPRHFNFDHGVWDTFVGWLAVLNPVEGFVRWDSRWQSFPSGHATTGIAFAWGLSRLYPRGRLLFAVFALLAMGQRIESGAHYISDTLVGAAIGSVVFWLFDRRTGLGRWFDRFEGRSGEE